MVPWDSQGVKVNGETNAGSKTLITIKTKEDKLFFTILEHEISKYKISSFIDIQNEWEGPVEDTSLFNLWKLWHDHQQQNTEEKVILFLYTYELSTRTTYILFFQQSNELVSIQEPEPLDLVPQDT